MNKILIKNLDKKIIGELIIDNQNNYQLNVNFDEDKKLINLMLQKYFSKGIRQIGDIILNKSIMPGDKGFLDNLIIKISQAGYDLELTR